MKIEQIKLPEAYKRSFLRHQRCCRLVAHSGTGFGRKPMKKCRRFATYKLQGVALCTQHAGEMALSHLIEKGKA